MGNHSHAVCQLHRSLAAGLRPPEKMLYSDWAAKNFRLSGNTAQPGRFKPWKNQRGILDAIGDPLTPRVSVIKSARTGYTTSLVAAFGADAINDPGPTILLMPTDDDARGIVVDEIDPAFKDTPILRGLMSRGRMDGRNTLTQRSMLGGGSLKVISAMAPRNLRRHTAKRLYCDEVDGMRVTKEGNPVTIGIKRTTSYADRKIVCGSTPIDEATSLILPMYNESDQRIFEIICKHCNEPFELLWEHMDWKTGRPETVVAICPHCGSALEDRYKPQMVEDGDWRAMKPEVQEHAGFRMNALTSMFANATWKKLVEEYEAADRGGPSEMQVFVNTVLGKVWSAAINYMNENQLMARSEDFGIIWDIDRHEWRTKIPVDVAYITAGVDVQHDRLEITFVGWSPEHTWILGHHVIFGGTDLETTYDELDYLLSTKWQHPLGGKIGVEAACVDSGDGNRTQYVYDFCEKVQGRKIVAIKGDDGPRPVMQVSSSRRRNFTAPLYIVGVDQVKTTIMVSLPREPQEPHSIRFSNTLEEQYFIQLTSERRELVYKAGRPVITFVAIGNRKQEGLDCTTYGIAAKAICRFDFEQRRELLKGKAPKGGTLAESVAKLHGKR